MANKLIGDLVTFSRGTGATRVNAAGLIVGVDFSATSNTITTGSKTFTLTADANVNRDWAVNSNVIAVSQAGATGSMTGVVTSYTPSTQALVINVTSVTGSGTSTDWRIGSLEMREDYDPVTLVRRGVLSEGQGSNLFTFSNDVSNVVWAKTGVTTVTPTISPSGISDFWKVQEDNSTGRHFIGRITPTTSGSPYVMSFYVSSAGKNFIRFFTNFAGNNSTAFDLTSGTITNNDNAGATTISLFSPGVYKISRQFISTGGNTFQLCLRPNGGLDDASEIYTGDGVSGIRVWGLNITQGSGDSHIPTTTAQVTRNADNFPLTASALTSIRQGEGTLYAEIDCPDTGVAQKRALRLSGTNADIRIGKQGTGTLSNFTKMAEGAGLRLMPATTTLIRGNGQEMVSANLIDERSGLVVTGFSSVNAIVFNGSDRFGGSAFGEEYFTNALATSYSAKGTGNATISSAHYNGNRFLMSVSNNAGIVLLSDGTSYRRVNTPVITQPTSEITSGLVGATLRNVIVGNTGFIATSDDNGETWTARTSGTTQNRLAVTFNGTNQFLAVGVGGVTSRSSDAITWESGTIPIAAFDVHFANGVYVAVGGSGNTQRIYTSTDAITFTLRFSGAASSGDLNGVTYSQSLNLWISVGGNGGIVTATDPTGTWTVQTSGTTQSLQEVGIFNNAIYVVGNNQTLLTSTNGTSYTSLSAGVSGTLVGIAASPTTLLITGANGAMASSTDGTTFTSRTNNNSNLNGIAFGNNVFVSVGNVANGSGYIATIAADGTVTRRVSGTTGSFLNVRFLNGAFYTVGSASTGTTSRSTDGITYTAVGGATAFNDIGFGGGILCRVGANGGSAGISTDNGATFLTTVTGIGGTTQTLNSIDFANGLFVTVGNAGTILTAPPVQSTANPNRFDWTLRTSGTTQNLNSVMYSTRDSLWYAAGNGGVLLYSPDAITWTAVQNSGTASILGTTLQSNQPLPQFKSGVNKIALSYKQNQVIAALNGVASTSDTTATIPTITAASIAENLNGYIGKVEIFPTALTTAELTAKTL